jgi:hypothetical protein
MTLLATSCSTQGPREAGAPVTTAPSLATSPTPMVCPGASAPSEITQWPAPVPADLPRPPSSRRLTVSHPSKQVTVVRFTSSAGLRDSILFMLRELPDKGFQTGRGDAEPTEADIPFGRNGSFGQIRMVAVTPCRTEWLVAVGAPRSTTGPLLPPHRNNPVPLPTFG